MMSPRCMPARNAGLPCSTSETSTPSVSDGARRRRADVGRQRAERDAEALRRFARPARSLVSRVARARLPSSSRSSSSTVTLSGRLLLVAQDLHRHGRARLGARPRCATSSSRFFTGLPLNSRMTSPGSMPALAAGRPRVTVPTSAPRRSFRPNSASASSGNRLTR